MTKPVHVSQCQQPAGSKALREKLATAQEVTEWKVSGHEFVKNRVLRRALQTYASFLNSVGAARKKAPPLHPRNHRLPTLNISRHSASSYIYCRHLFLREGRDSGTGRHLFGVHSCAEIRGNKKIAITIVAAPVDACVAKTHRGALEVKQFLPESPL